MTDERRKEAEAWVAECMHEKSQRTSAPFSRVTAASMFRELTDLLLAYGSAQHEADMARHDKIEDMLGQADQLRYQGPAAKADALKIRAKAMTLRHDSPPLVGPPPSGEER